MVKGVVKDVARLIVQEEWSSRDDLVWEDVLGRWESEGMVVDV